MNIKVIKRGRALQITANLTVLDQSINLEITRHLKAGTKTQQEANDAFMAQLLATAGQAGNDQAAVRRCFAAMDDHPEMDPDVEQQEVIHQAKSELLNQARQVLDQLVRQGEESQRLLANLSVENIEVVEPSEGMGICPVCLKEFKLQHAVPYGTMACDEHRNKRCD